MIAWKHGHLVVSSMRNWADISLLDYFAAYKAMVRQKNRERWVKIIDLTDLAGELGDASQIQKSETVNAIRALSRWSVQEGLVAQVIVVGPNVKPSILESLAQIYKLQTLPVQYCNTLEDAYRLALKHQIQPT